MRHAAKVSNLITLNFTNLSAELFELSTGQSGRETVSGVVVTYHISVVTHHISVVTHHILY